MRTLACLIIIVGLISCGAPAPRQVVNEAEFQQQVLSTAEKMKVDGKLVKAEVLRAQLAELKDGNRQPQAIPLAKPRSDRLDPTEILDRIRPSTLYIALCFVCPNCKHLHMSGASGYLVAPGVVATNRHVIEVMSADITKVKEGYMVAADSQGRVWPIVEVLASGRNADACLVRIGATDLPPLAFSDQARAGTAVYCLSHPQENHWRFTDGIIARYVVRSEEQREKGKTRKLDQPVVMVDVTCDYAPGSSGAPIVDNCGNVVAMVESIRSAGGTGDGKYTQVASWVRECVAAEEIRALAQPDGR